MRRMPCDAQLVNGMNQEVLDVLRLQVLFVELEMFPPAHYAPA